MRVRLCLRQTNPLAFKWPTFITRIWSWREPISCDRSSTGAIHARSPLQRERVPMSVLLSQSISAEAGGPTGSRAHREAALLRQDTELGFGEQGGAASRVCQRASPAGAPSSAACAFSVYGHYEKKRGSQGWQEMHMSRHTWRQLPKQRHPPFH